MKCSTAKRLYVVRAHQTLNDEPNQVSNIGLSSCLNTLIKDIFIAQKAFLDSFADLVCTAEI